MPPGRETGRIGDRYALDYYRHPREGRSWKWPATALAMALALIGSGALYGFWGKKAFQAAPLAGVHAAFGGDCRKCHDAAWQPAVRLVTGQDAARSVANASCLACHVDTADHHPYEGGSASACAACHSEHRPEHDLRDIADSFCLSCHRDLGEQGVATGEFASKITGFAGGNDPHPEFAILRQPSRDPGGLIFNHAAHLAPDGVLGPPDRRPTKLTCGDCHVPTRDGALMAPVNYESHCSRCHPLNLSGAIERLNPIPHELPELIRGYLREKLANEQPSESAVEDGEMALEAPGANERQSLLPGPKLVSPSRVEFVDAELAEADHTIFGLEAKGFCRKCHYLEADNRLWRVLATNPATASTGIDADLAATMVPDWWFAHARFDHEKHQAAAVCAKCHQADQSAATSDVLLPSIATCRECHGAAATNIASGVGASCTQCHEYHTSTSRRHP
jgi:hypothetical protein